MAKLPLEIRDKEVQTAFRIASALVQHLQAYGMEDCVIAGLAIAPVARVREAYIEGRGVFTFQTEEERKKFTIDMGHYENCAMVMPDMNGQFSECSCGFRERHPIKDVV